MRVSTLWKQITIYDEDFNIIKEIPERPPPKPDSEVRMINIVEFEKRLLGIDPNKKPDFFIDFENDERFMDVDKDPKFSTYNMVKAGAINDHIILGIIFIVSVLIGCLI